MQQHPSLNIFAAARKQIGLSPVCVKRKALTHIDIDWASLKERFRADFNAVDPAQRTALRLKTVDFNRVEEVIAGLFEYTAAVKNVSCLAFGAFAHIDNRNRDVCMYGLHPDEGKISFEIATHWHFSAAVSLLIFPAIAVCQSRDEFSEAIRRLTSKRIVSLEERRVQQRAEDLRDSVNGSAVLGKCDDTQLLMHCMASLIADTGRNVPYVRQAKLVQLLPRAFPNWFSSQNSVVECIAFALELKLLSMRTIQLPNRQKATTLYIEPAGRELISHYHSH